MIACVRRLIATNLALLSIGLLAAGCGSSKHGGSEAQNSSQALAYAQAVNLRKGDFPGAMPFGQDQETARANYSVNLLRCGGVLIPGAEFGGIHSPRFFKEDKPGFEEALSGVRVMSSAAVAAQRLAANQTASVRACFASAVGLQDRKSVVQIETAPLPAVLRSVPGSFALREVFTLAHRRETRSGTTLVFQDLFGFPSGRAVIGLTVARSLKPFPVAIEQHLLALLLSRASAHHL
jgi:hypothetical protein